MIHRGSIHAVLCHKCRLNNAQTCLHIWNNLMKKILQSCAFWLGNALLHVEDLDSPLHVLPKSVLGQKFEIDRYIKSTGTRKTAIRLGWKLYSQRPKKSLWRSYSRAGPMPKQKTTLSFKNRRTWEIFKYVLGYRIMLLYSLYNKSINKFWASKPTTKYDLLNQNSSGPDVTWDT